MGFLAKSTTVLAWRDRRAPAGHRWHPAEPSPGRCRRAAGTRRVCRDRLPEPRHIPSYRVAAGDATIGSLPTLNAHLERFHLSLKSECLSRMIFFGEDSLHRAVQSYLVHYHQERNHQGLGNKLIAPEGTVMTLGKSLLFAHTVRHRSSTESAQLRRRIRIVSLPASALGSAAYLLPDGSRATRKPRRPPRYDGLNPWWLPDRQ